MSAPSLFSPISMAAGPRNLPDWVRDAEIRWRDGYSSRPDFIVRCRRDPLAFTDAGNPVWQQRSEGMWIAERDGVAAVHYHKGRVAMAEFEKHIEWIEKPSQSNGWKGEARTESYQMLATSQQEGYAGRHFNITLEDGTPIRLRGPWHGNAPPGYREVSYFIDGRDPIPKPGRRWRPWHQRGGFFGLYVREELLLDIMATHQAHIRWAICEWPDGKTRKEPLRPETMLPKGVFVDPVDCPGHRWRGEGGGARCLLCNRRRNPAWRSPYDKSIRLDPDRKPPSFHSENGWPSDVAVPLRAIPERGVIRYA